MQPNRVTYLTVASICRQAGRLDLALEAYNDMRAAGQRCLKLMNMRMNRFMPTASWQIDIRIQYPGFAPCDREFQAITEAAANQVFPVASLTCIVRSVR